MAVSVGLSFDLSAWKNGVKSAAATVRNGLNDRVLAPFDKTIKKVGAGMKRVFGGIGKVIKGAMGPLLAIVLPLATFAGLKNIVMGSLEAFRQYSDSVTTLQASLRSIGVKDVAGATKAVGELGEKLRLSLGITAAETNTAFANFVTRGFDVGKARQLTILAANYAKKSGKPIADVQKQIADAANGEVGAIKELGIQITATGNKVADAQAAVAALKGAYGDIGADLANPSERLSAAWNALAVSLGEKISPVIEPLIQGFSDFVTGLTKTEEGRKALDGVADTIKSIIEWTLRLTTGISNLVQMVTAGGGVVWNYLNKLFNDLVAMLFDKLKSLPGGEFLMEKLGFDPEFAAQSYRDGAAEAQKALGESMNGFMKAQNDFFNGADNTGAVGFINKIREAGKTAREDATKSLSNEIAATKGQTFAGQAAIDAEKQKAQAELKKRATAYGDAGAGKQVQVRIMSLGPDRFRKAG